MTCTRVGNAIICTSPSFRLRLTDGTCVFMEFHHYCGPMFFKDREQRREIDEWWDNDLICEALDWFLARGRKA